MKQPVKMPIPANFLFMPTKIDQISPTCEREHIDQIDLTKVCRPRRTDKRFAQCLKKTTVNN